MKQRRIALDRARDVGRRGRSRRGRALEGRGIPAAGGRVVAAREFTPGEVDQTQLAQALNVPGATALVVWGPPADAARVTQAVRRIEWNAQIAGPARAVRRGLPVAGRHRRRTARRSRLPFRRDWFSASVAAFFLRYQTRFGIVTIPRQQTLIPDLPVLAMAAHDAVILAADAASARGPSPEKITAGAAADDRTSRGSRATYTFTPGRPRGVRRARTFGWRASTTSPSSTTSTAAPTSRSRSPSTRSRCRRSTCRPSSSGPTKGAELQQRILEDVLTNPEKVEFFKAYRPPRPPPGPC